ALEQHGLGQLALVFQVGKVAAGIQRGKHRAIDQELTVLVCLDGGVELPAHGVGADVLLGATQAATGEQYHTAQQGHGGNSGQQDGKTDHRTLLKNHRCTGEV